jgi:hypothetical protein
MKLYLLTQTVNNDYDTYDSCVVAAENADDAQVMHPRYPDGDAHTWASSKKVAVKLLGEALDGTEQGVICASFNAG